MKNKILIIITTLILTANAGYSMPAAVKSAVVKFSLAMGGVVISSILLFLILSLYNKFRSDFDYNVTSEEEVLKHPKTKEEAIKFFIRKNRI